MLKTKSKKQNKMIKSKKIYKSETEKKAVERGIKNSEDIASLNLGAGTAIDLSPITQRLTAVELFTEGTAIYVKKDVFDAIGVHTQEISNLNQQISNNSNDIDRLINQTPNPIFELNSVPTIVGAANGLNLLCLCIDVPATSNISLPNDIVQILNFSAINLENAKGILTYRSSSDVYINISQSIKKIYNPSGFKITATIYYINQIER